MSDNQFFALLTAIGEAKLANAIALDQMLSISQLGVGDANGAVPIPNRQQTQLINEVRRAGINQLSIDPDNDSVIIAEQVIPPEVGGWWICEIGLYDEAGDLIAVANCPETYKPELAEGAGRTQVIRIHLIVSSAQNIQLKIDPAVVLATRQYVDNALNIHSMAPDPHPQYVQRGNVITLVDTGAIPATTRGLILLDASAGNRQWTLPASVTIPADTELLFRRLDQTKNSLIIQAATDDQIMLDNTTAAAGKTQTELIFPGDYLRLRSDGKGGWWCIGQAVLPGTIRSGIVSFSQSGIYTWIVPPVMRSGRIRPVVTVIGGGGGGGGGLGDPKNQGGGGGGGGGMAKRICDLTGVLEIIITVGAGGVGGTPGEDGSSGGSTSFGTLVTATGGGGGSGANAPAIGAGLSGNSVGGQIGLRPSASGVGSKDGLFAGFGGGHGGGIQKVSAGPGGYGYNGGGGMGSMGSYQGGLGGSGVVIIEW